MVYLSEETLQVNIPYKEVTVIPDQELSDQLFKASLA